jgi:hypothetical protein
MKYISSIEQYIKEARYLNGGIEIIFKDFCFEYFSNSYKDMINWLKANWRNKRVYFICPDGDIIKRKGIGFFVVKTYVMPTYDSYDNEKNVVVKMFGLESGAAKGLIFYDKIEMPTPIYKRVKNTEVDPFDEEDWWEKIE